jgi:hypothetical protein
VGIEQGFSSFASIAIFCLLGLGCFGCQQEPPVAPKTTEEAIIMPMPGAELTAEQVAEFAKLAIKNIHTEFPNKPSNVMAGPESVQSPQEMHPAFFGCFDWHSSVHGHWMLVRLLKQYPDHPINSLVREKLAANLTPEKLLAEADYFRLEHNKSFERMYGWAWYFRLAEELQTFNDEQARQWRKNLLPLEELLVERVKNYLPKLTFPIRTGVHPDTGFALAQILDYARTMGNKELEELVVQRSRDYYLADVEYPTRYEPSGQDFFSSCLNEADLMRRVLPAEEFSKWFDRYLPALAHGDGGNLLIPVEVSDVTDGKIVHLAGLDLSRGWCMEGIARSLPDGDKRRELLEAAAAQHAAMGYKYIFSGHYEGEHWLATFAVYLQTRVSLDAD